MIVSLIDFLISSVILLLLMLWYEFYPDWRVIVLPLLLVLASITALGSGYWISAINVKYRDFRYIIPFLVQFGLLISPVGFSSNIVPEKWRLVYSINPMVGVIDGFRWALLSGESKIYWPGFLLSVVLAVLVFIGGVRFFRKTERSFADVI
jgi:lipopolysaccharide transport system permease protein